jgi:hypothetical protein
VLEGLGGTLLSRRFLSERVPALLPVYRDERGARFPAALARWWRRVHATCGPATSVRALVDVALRPLAALVEAELARPSRLSHDLWSTALRAGDACLPLVATCWGRPPESAWRETARLALASGTRWCAVYNGTHLRLSDAGVASARRHADFDFQVLCDDERAARLAWALVVGGCLAPAGDGSPSDSALGHLVSIADREGAEICEGLRSGVREALEHLASGVLAAGSRGRRCTRTVSTAYDHSLTAVYRMLFLLFAEARGLVPGWHPVYGPSYTMEALRTQVEGPGDARGTWETFQAMSRLAHAGCEADDLRVTAFNGRLFAPHRAPLLDTCRVPDAAMAAAVRALSTSQTPRGRERVSYADLGVEELGAVYETLLEYEPRATAGGRAPAVVLERTGPARRKTTGTFYTPEALTRYLVAQTLQPLTAGAAPDAVLGVRVADPAMGSGAFLVAACRFLAHAYEAALVRQGQARETDITADDRAGFRRLVAQRCLYGADANPMAVHLARLSLWLTTLAADRPLGFLDHHLVSGDSLLGVSAGHVTQRAPARRPGRRADERQLPLFALDGLLGTMQHARAVRSDLAARPDTTADEVRRKERALDHLHASADLGRWRAVCDLWCAVFLDDTRVSPSLYAALAQHELQAPGPLPHAVAEHAMAPLRRAASDRRFLHWPLEFPEVFCDAAGREWPDGGFDAVVGNPPWEMVRADVGRLHGSDSATIRFSRRSGLYHAQSDGHLNLYQVFVERAVHLVRPGGRIGLVVPHGLASDQGAAPLRHLLLRQCATDRLVGFENRSGVFPIHRGVRFLLVTATRGRETRSIACRFGLHDPAVLDRLCEAEQDEPRSAFPIRLTPALLERLSGPGLAIPDLRTPLDLQIAEKLAAAHPRVTAAAGWGARFGRELNASDDREHFTRGRDGLPVLEGKHLSPFVVRHGEAVQRIAADRARQLLPGQPYLRDRLAFRDVTSATNRTTLIAALVPAGCVTTHTLFCLRPPLPAREQLVLCALFNSYVANYLVRMRVSSHVTLAVLDTLPMPRLHAGEALGATLAARAKAMASGRGGDVEPELQGLSALAYGLTPAEFAHVLGTFPLVPEGQRSAAFDAFTRASRR